VLGAIKHQKSEHQQTSRDPGNPKCLLGLMRENPNSQLDDNAHSSDQQRTQIPFPRRGSASDGNRSQHLNTSSAIIN
jgi:hypothetical protein